MCEKLKAAALPWLIFKDLQSVCVNQARKAGYCPADTSASNSANDLLEGISFSFEFSSARPRFILLT